MLTSKRSYEFKAREQHRQVTTASIFFEAYITDSRDWDNLMFNVPNYLMVVAPSNDGTDDSANTNPTRGLNFNKLIGYKTSKNNLVVAAGNGATRN